MNELLGTDGYWCVICGRYLQTDANGVIVHDNLPHPEAAADEEMSNWGD